VPCSGKTWIRQAGPAIWNQSSDALAVVSGGLAMCPLGSRVKRDFA
jgi:hypothetical protein